MRDRLPIIFSTTALVVSVIGITPLGQAAYNAVVPSNSVGTVQLKSASVTAAKLHTDAVTGAKVKNGTLGSVDFAQGQLPAGAKGDKGDRGESGATNVVVRSKMQAPTPAYGISSGDFTLCQAGERAVGGGVSAGSSSIDPNFVVLASTPIPATAGVIPTGWFGAYYTTRAGIQPTIYVICAKP